MGELRHAIRQLFKSPGYSLIAILTVALGIAASTVMFTVVNSVLLRPLPFHHSERLAVVWESIKALGPLGAQVGPNPKHVDLWQKGGKSFVDFAHVTQGSAGLSLGGDHPRQISVLSATPNLLGVLGVKPVIGRDFDASERNQRAAPVAIITYQLWISTFGGELQVIGKTLKLDGKSKQIVGVLPETFRFPKRSVLRTFAAAAGSAEKPEASLIVPMVLDLNEFSWDGDFGNMLAITRLRPGISFGRAGDELNALEKQAARFTYADGRRSPDELTARLQPLRQAIVAESRKTMWLLMAAVGSITLIACLNLANANLGRALAHQREAAIRSALGASSAKLLLHGFAESVVLAAAGGVCGFLLASFAPPLLQSMKAVDMPRASEITIDFRVLAFSFLAIAITGIIAGLLPAFGVLNTDPQLALRNDTRAGLSKGTVRMRKLLIFMQVFGCTVLLLAGAVFGKDLYQVLASPRGFDTDNVAVAEVALPSYGREGRQAFFRNALASLSSLPGATAAGMVSAMPLEGESWIESLDPVGSSLRQKLFANLRWCSPGYFEAMRQPLVAGRFLEEADGSRNNAVISQTAARLGWPGGNALGRKFKTQDKIFSVVGIVADSRINGLKKQATSMIYAPYQLEPVQNAYLVVRGSGAAASLLESVRQAIWKQDANVNVVRVKTLAAQVGDSVASDVFRLKLLGGFGIAALCLSMFGIYGVLSHSVSVRRRELGIRLALGAGRRSIYSVTVRQAAVPVIGGLAGGCFFSIVIGRFLETLLVGTKAVDPIAILLVAAVSLIATALASAPPAHRAASIDPAESLRAE